MIGRKRESSRELQLNRKQMISNKTLFITPKNDNPGRTSPWLKIPKIRSVLRYPSLSILGSLRNASGLVKGPPLNMPSLLHDGEKWWSKKIKRISGNLILSLGLMTQERK